MALLKLILLTILLTTLYPVEIDMHGGKEIKIPSQLSMQMPKSMHAMLHSNIKKKDTNETNESK